MTLPNTPTRKTSPAPDPAQLERRIRQISCVYPAGAMARGGIFVHFLMPDAARLRAAGNPFPNQTTPEKEPRK